jgi:hypothetical protein
MVGVKVKRRLVSPPATGFEVVTLKSEKLGMLVIFIVRPVEYCIAFERLLIDIINGSLTTKRDLGFVNYPQTIVKGFL